MSQSNIEFKFLRLEDSRAILLFGKEEYALPKKIIPDEIMPGQSFCLSISSEKNKIKTAKEILNELLS